MSPRLFLDAGGSLEDRLNAVVEFLSGLPNSQTLGDGTVLTGGTATSSRAVTTPVLTEPRTDLRSLTFGGGTAGYILVATGSSTYRIEAPGTRVLMQGNLADRPTAGVLGRVYVATNEDDGTPYIDTGTGWQQAAAGVAAGPEFSPDETRRVLQRLIFWLGTTLGQVPPGLETEFAAGAA